MFVLLLSFSFFFFLLLSSCFSFFLLSFFFLSSSLFFFLLLSSSSFFFLLLSSSFFFFLLLLSSFFFLLSSFFFLLRYSSFKSRFSAPYCPPRVHTRRAMSLLGPMRLGLAIQRCARFTPAGLGLARGGEVWARLSAFSAHLASRGVTGCPAFDPAAPCPQGCSEAAMCGRPYPGAPHSPFPLEKHCPYHE